jgi:septum formation protein
LKVEEGSGLMAEGAPRLVLASASKARAALLRSAGVVAHQRPAKINEAVVRADMDRNPAKLPADEVALELARVKAQVISVRTRKASVIGADQVLEFQGDILAKPADLDEAREQLLRLRGKTHMLHSAVCVARDGRVVWHHVDTAKLTMRASSPAFIDDYLAAAGRAALSSAGGYQLEGPGIQLFSHIDGDYFTILGLPLLPLLDYLRRAGVLKA